ncbi:MAG: hypothetical protein ACI8UD_001020 [Planctomycetota bacterium]|jgi:hypothetical protein
MLALLATLAIGAVSFTGSSLPGSSSTVTVSAAAPDGAVALLAAASSDASTAANTAASANPNANPNGRGLFAPIKKDQPYELVDFDELEEEEEEVESGAVAPSTFAPTDVAMLFVSVRFAVKCAPHPMPGTWRRPSVSRAPPLS